jgi:hypothetical protein
MTMNDLKGEIEKWYARLIDTHTHTKMYHYIIKEACILVQVIISW